ncbi:UNVERIFIED_CONTAM: hypothetical protein NCL1_21301 [Trichonephila clavipes]
MENDSRLATCGLQAAGLEKKKSYTKTKHKNVEKGQIFKELIYQLRNPGNDPTSYSSPCAISFSCKQCDCLQRIR